MRDDIRDAFRAAIPSDNSRTGRMKTDRVVNQEALILMKQVEAVLENVEDQDMTISEFLAEIAGQGHYG